MIQNFASSVAKRELSESWVTRFLHRNESHLMSKWATAMDRTRHKADSYFKYKQYFGLLHYKLKDYCLEAYNIYNIDKKGFLIRLIRKSKRIFSKR